MYCEGLRIQGRRQCSKSEVEGDANFRFGSEAVLDERKRVNFDLKPMVVGRDGPSGVAPEKSGRMRGNFSFAEGSQFMP